MGERKTELGEPARTAVFRATAWLGLEWPISAAVIRSLNVVKGSILVVA